MNSNEVPWFSIPADSLSRATQFYKSAFGWQIEPLIMEKNDDFSFHVAVNSKSDAEYILNKKEP